MALLKLNKSGRKAPGFLPSAFSPLSQSTPEKIPQWQQKQLPTEKCKRQNSQEENASPSGGGIKPYFSLFTFPQLPTQF